MQTASPAPFPTAYPAPYRAPLHRPCAGPLPGPYAAPYPAAFPAPYPAAPLPARPPVAPRSGRHAAPASAARRRGRAVVLTVLVLLLIAAAVAAALLIPASATRPVDAALDQLGGWTAISVDGDLTGDGGPVHLAATITADGAARGVLTRAGDARAEFVVSGPGALLRGNAPWWRTSAPERADLLADRWVRDPRDGVVDQVARGRLAPRALTDALAGLRDPAQRTRAEVVTGGVSGTSYDRLGARLVVGRDGRPLALTVRLGGAPSAVVKFRSGPALGADPAGADPASSWDATLAVGVPNPADVDAVRRTVADAVAQVARDAGAEPTGDDSGAGTAGAVTVEGRPDPAGCRPTGCTMHYRLTNRGDVAVMGLFTVRVDDAHVVAARALTLPPRSSGVLAVEIPVRLVAAHPDGKVKVAGLFTAYGDV